MKNTIDEIDVSSFCLMRYKQTKEFDIQSFRSFENKEKVWATARTAAEIEGLK